MAIKVMIADDHPFFRRGIREDLAAHRDVEIVYEVGNGAEAIALLEKDRTLDILLLDLAMPVLSGYEVLEEVRRMSHPVRTIVVTMHRPEEVIHRITALGAHGCVPKENETGDLYQAIHEVAGGGSYFGRSADTAPAVAMRFKPHEISIIKCLDREMTNQQIADELHVGLRTVERTRSELIHRAGAKNAHGLVLYARSRGLI
jgi:DNA-binding NarL/FixJ family response regulator